jgi:ABC-type Fe3+-citrate transport system substrate-binding protein
MLLSMEKEKEKRVISLVPSWTTTLCDLGLEKALVGCTNHCSHPKSLRRRIPSVGGTKDASFEAIASLNPSHVVTNSEENDGTLIARLERELPGTVVIKTMPLNPTEAIADIVRMARILQAPPDDVTRCLNTIESAKQELTNLLDKGKDDLGRNPIPFVYLIWMNPWMAAGNQTYISALLQEGCFSNQLQTGSAMHERYPAMESGKFDTAEIRSHYWLFSSEPFAFRKRHLDTFAKEWGVPRDRCIKVDGQALSWYGSFLAQGYRELVRIRKMIAASRNSDESSS